MLSVQNAGDWSIGRGAASWFTWHLIPLPPFVITPLYPESVLVRVEYASQCTVLSCREMGVDAQNKSKARIQPSRPFSLAITSSFHHFFSPVHQDFQDDSGLLLDAL